MSVKVALKSEQECGTMSFSDNLKRLRQDKGFTQLDLARASGLRTASISQLERNEGDPKLSTIYKLMDALECSADALLLDINHLSLSGILKTMLERAEKLPEREKAIIIDVIDTYCITNGFNEVVDQGWRKFALITKDGMKDQKVLDQINKDEK